MSTKITSNNTNIIKNEVDFDTEVLNYLESIGHIRRRQLVRDLISAHQDERGYSQKSIDRKLGNLVKIGQVLILKKPEELEVYGIVKEDGKASYLVSKRTSDIRKHLDNIFSLLESGNHTDQKLVLKELEGYQEMYILNRKQMDALVRSLINANDELRHHLLRIIYNHVTKKEIKPLDEETFLKNLRLLLNQYPDIPKKYPSIRTHLILLLGHYNDDTVVEQLIEDVRNIEDLNYVKNDYWFKENARVIENHREQLFELERELRKSGKDESANTIASIRYQARINLGWIKDPLTDMGEF
ncbi:hypothetical protein HNV12_12820 [Methanococcoides sp. SA1]|nr:hypothetical protein [Methanococcoides sp. SA1]